MTDSDTGVVEQTLRISARPETVWRYWTDPERMCEWWASAAEIDPRPGGIYWVDVVDGGTMRGEVVELVPYERLVFTFGCERSQRAPEITPGSTTVEITLAADGGDTVMTLRHTGLPSAFVELHDAGWGSHLPVLVAAVERSDA